MLVRIFVLKMIVVVVNILLVVVKTYMMLRAVLVLLIAASCNAEVLYEWREIDYEWPSTNHRATAISNGDYVPERIRIGAVKEWDETVYVLTPRSPAGGVPATISAVVPTDQGSPVLRPFPSWE